MTKERKAPKRRALRGSKQAVVDYARRARAAGASLQLIARELRMRKVTLWASEGGWTAQDVERLLKM